VKAGPGEYPWVAITRGMARIEDGVTGGIAGMNGGSLQYDELASL